MNWSGTGSFYSLGVMEAASMGCGTPHIQPPGIPSKNREAPELTGESLLFHMRGSWQASAGNLGHLGEPAFVLTSPPPLFWQLRQVGDAESYFSKGSVRMQNTFPMDKKKKGRNILEQSGCSVCSQLNSHSYPTNWARQKEKKIQFPKIRH